MWSFDVSNQVWSSNQEFSEKILNFGGREIFMSVWNEELYTFLETPKLILTLIQTIYIGFKQRLVQKWNIMHIVTR